ncbi:MAG: hydroxypyruvate isomerase family protein [Rhodoblastus sp.]
MPKFAANLSMMFTEHPFLDRFDAAAAAGFAAVEYLFPYEHSSADIAARLKRNDLTQALFNLPPGDFAAGERGLAALSGRAEEFRASVDRALEYAAATGVKRLHMMAGLASSRDPKALVTYQGALELAARKLGDAGLDLVIEPINTRNMPGYFLNDFDLAARIIADSGMANVKLQFDIYHRQIMHGDVTMALRALMPITGHVQIASVPSRNEPDGEELNYPFLFAELDRLGYDGYVGCEYNPRGKTTDGLAWFKPYARN